MHNWSLIWWKSHSLSFTIQNCILEGSYLLKIFPSTGGQCWEPEGQRVGVWQSLEACGTQPELPELAGSSTPVLVRREGTCLVTQVGGWVCCCWSQDGDTLGLQALPCLQAADQSSSRDLWDGSI